MSKIELTTDELIERISIALQEMEGQDLAMLYNREFGENMTYNIDEEIFYQEIEDNQEIED